MVGEGPGKSQENGKLQEAPGLRQAAAGAAAVTRESRGISWDGPS